MDRSRIFVSYSHRDADKLEQLKRFLKTLERDGRVDVWDDTRLAGGDEWRSEIEVAIDGASAAVLMISQDLLASDFVYEEEIPRILRRAANGELTVVPVFLSASTVEESTFPYHDPRTNEKRHQKLTDFQGFGSPDRPLSKHTWADRERIYEKLAKRLSRLGNDSPLSAVPPASTPRLSPLPAPPAHEYELTIELDRRRDALETRYHLPGREPIATATAKWDEVHDDVRGIADALDSGDHKAIDELIAKAPTTCGPVLFRLLFGNEDCWRPILRQLFHRSASDAQPTPVWSGVRLRICTEEALLLGLPWRLTAWQRRLLVDDGWTFQTTTIFDPTEVANTAAPSNTLIVAPGSLGEAPDRDHAAAVAELLKDIWATGREPRFVRVVTRLDQLRGSLAGMSPHVLYFHGRGGLRHGRPSLLFDDGRESLALSALAEMLGTARRPPALIHLDAPGLIGDGAPTPGQLLLNNGVRLVSWRRLADADNDTTAVTVAWLKRWLSRGEDPIAAFHAVQREAPPRVAVDFAIHSDYKAWKTSTSRGILDRRRLPRLRLDRDHQKALVGKHLAELARSDTRRVMALVAFGDSGNSLPSLWRQLRDYLELELADRAEIDWLHLEFPAVRGELVRDLEHELRLQLGGDDDEPITHLLRRLAPKAAPGRRPVLWIDWGTFGRPKSHQQPLAKSHLCDWLRFSSEILGTYCPQDLRLVSYLTIEATAEKHERLATDLRRERKQPWCKRADFRLTALPPLGSVSEDDLLDFLEDPANSSCDPGIQDEIAERLIVATGGRFEDVVATMEEAEKASWYDLLLRLRRQQGDAPPEEDETY